MYEHMTIFYVPRTGTIKEVYSGEKDHSIFGELQPEYEAFYEKLIVEFDEMIFKEMNRFEVVDSQLKMKPEEIPERYR